MAGLNLSGMMGGGLVTENPTFQQSVLQNVQQGAGLARQSFGKAAGVDTRNHGERAKQELSKLDPTKPQDQAKIVELVGAINHEKGLELKAKYSAENKEKADKDKLGGALLKMARANGNTNAEAWLLAGGDVRTIASQVLKRPELDKPTAPTTMYLDGKPIKASVIGGKMHYASENGWTVLKDDAKLSAQAPKDAKTEDTKISRLTTADIDFYEASFNVDEELQSAYTEVGENWYNSDKVSEDKKLQVMTRAQAIYANNVPLGQLGALKQAVAEAGGTLPPAQTAAQEKSSDSFSSLKKP